ncbi:MAG TPA: GntR family transcriptional regulator [Gaiellaceae bacterium]|nr:GntR family transcriptional regulator [Gaiellaceae bacterium]
MSSEVVRTTTTRELINRLRQEIYGGTYPPGARLRQGALATRFGVSTTPVREALSALQAEGLVTVDPHRGAVVVQPTPDDVRESFAIREVLETLALESAIPVISEAQLDQLQSYIAEMQGVSTYDEWALLNETFHRELYEASRRRRLCDLIESLRVSSQHFIHLALSGRVPGPEVDAEHQAILDACRSRNIQAARAALHRHIEHTGQRTLEHLSAPATADGAA